MSWGTTLWDQYENLSSHTNKGIEFLGKYGEFVKQRCMIEDDYAQKLRRLVKTFQPKKSDDKENAEFTSYQAFNTVLKETGDLAGQRELVSENLQAQIVTSILLLSKNLRDDRKKSLNECASLTQSLNNQINALDKAKRNYEKTFRESEKAIENYHKADADFHLSRAEVEKQKYNMTVKCGQSDDAKNEYANQLQKTNKLQQTHYEKSLPEVFNRLQELDEKRTRGLKEFIRRSAEIESSVASIIAKCLEGVIKSSELINEKEDSLKVIERYQSGFNPPGDVPFEDLSKPDASVSSTNSTTNLLKSNTSITGTTKLRIKSRSGIFGIFAGNKNSISTEGSKDDFSELPPTQRRKKLLGKVQDLQDAVQREQMARDGLVKMKVVYETNPSLGDPMTVEGQLNESESKLERLRQESKKYQKLLDEANSQPISHSPQPDRITYNNGGQRISRHSNGSNENDDGEDHPDDAGSLSRSGSERSVAQPQNGLLNNNHIDNINGSSASPESGLGNSHTSLPGSGQGSTNEQQMNYDLEFDVEGLQPLGSCRALYTFDATSEGSIPMTEGEELQVIELDQGDGWTRVRRLGGPNVWDEGFVPTTYIESTLFA